MVRALRCDLSPVLLMHLGEGVASASDRHHAVAGPLPDAPLRAALRELTNGLLNQLAGAPQPRSPKA